ncbi:Thioredoxin like protein, partial [Aduncisulcus paluster]
MTVTTIKTLPEFKDFVSKNPKVIIDCFAEWCGPCKFISPRYHAMAEDPANAAVKFIQIDVDANPSLTGYLKITAMPTFIAFSHGAEAQRFSGASAEKIQ